jgi:hypothetical protein
MQPFNERARVYAVILAAFCALVLATLFYLSCRTLPLANLPAL